MELASPENIALALKRLGNYRVLRVQELAVEDGIADGISGAHLLALGMRETWGQNIEGGAKKDADGNWIPEDDPMLMDVGWLQISRRYHYYALKEMVGVRSGTWQPVIVGRTAAEGGFVPRFTDSLRFVIPELRASQQYARVRSVPKDKLVRFAIAAHNAGAGGALKGYHEGDMDRYTAGGDYSAWVLDAKKKVRIWINNHPNWKLGAT